MKVFISYSSIDRSDALDARRILEDNGCEVWLDAFDIHPAENLDEQLIDNINRADIFCLLLSPSSARSKWVLQEINQALQEKTKRGLRILPVLLRPCEIPNDIKNLTALKAYEGYQGFKNEHVHMRLVRAVLGEESVSDVVLDDAFEKYLKNLAEQKKAADILPQIASTLDQIREKPIRELSIHLDSNVFVSSIYREDPFIIEVKLELNNIFSDPLSFFFAPYQEGNTWPAGFNFSEPLYTDFHYEQPRVDGKLKWYHRIVDLSSQIDSLDMCMNSIIFNIKFDGAKFLPKSKRQDKFHPIMPAFSQALTPKLIQAFEIPSLKKLIQDRNSFKLILHKLSSQTAEVQYPEICDINFKLIASFPQDKLELVLYKSRHSEKEKIILNSEYLSGIVSSIEREMMLGLLPSETFMEDRMHLKSGDKGRCWIYKMLLLNDPNEIEWDDDRRLLARVLDHKMAHFAFRNHRIFLFNWEDVPGPGEQMIRNFLKEDFNYQDYFAHLIFGSLEEINNATITRDPADDSIQIKESETHLCIRLSYNKTKAIVYLCKDDGEERWIHVFEIIEDRGKYRIYVSDLLYVLHGCDKLISILTPLVFKHRPIFIDAYLLSKAANRLAQHFISLSEYGDAVEFINMSLSVALRMIRLYPREQEYIRLKGNSAMLMAEADIQLKRVEHCKQHMQESIKIFSKLYEELPNAARFEDLYKILERAKKMLSGSGLKEEDLLKEIDIYLSRMKSTKSKIIGLCEELKIDPGSTKFNIFDKMADELEISTSVGTLNGEETIFTRVDPKSSMTPEVWKEVNTVLERNQFHWTKMMDRINGNVIWHYYWERRIIKTE